MTLRQWKYLSLTGLFTVVIWSGCTEEEAGPAAPEVDVTNPVLPQFQVLPPGGGSGAIFTTDPIGEKVNENVHYPGRQYVYLDGGPKQNAPAHAAGLDEGFYVFQITDPPGKLLLSRDPARCRIVYVNDEGVIDQLMRPTDDGTDPVFGRTDSDGNSVVDYTAAATDNWQDPGQGNRPYVDEPCHVPGPDDVSPGAYAPTPDITGVGRHDTNPDTDHNDVGAIVVQMMPYGLTPNPGGVYKAWMTPIQAYVNVKQADLNEVPTKLNARQKPHECYDFCAKADPGFEPSHRYTKTDNFKVTEKFPAEILVRKFHDLNGDGLWQMGTEPEIGVDECVDEDGLIIDCGEGGWPYDFTWPVDGGTMTDMFYTPMTHVAGVPGTYSAEEYYFDDIDNGGYNKWRQTASWLDDSYQDPFQKTVDVDVAASGPGESHEIRFGNTLLARIRGTKVIDYDADGVIDPEDVCPTAAADPANNPGCAGVTVKLSGTDNLGNNVTDQTTTADDGSFAFKDLWPGTYKVTIDEPTGFYCSYPDPCEYTGIALKSGDNVFLGDESKGSFADWTPGKKQGVKYEDTDGDGAISDESGNTLGGWTIDLLKKDGTWAYVASATTDGTDGSYEFTGLTPGVTYGVCEVKQSGYTQTYPPASGNLDCSAIDSKYGAVGYEFVLESGEVEQNNDFGNFENVEVTVCKVKDADGNHLTTGDQTPKPGWEVYLTVNGTKVDQQYTTDGTPEGQDPGCYTWHDLPPLVPGGSFTGNYGSVDPLPAGSYYDVHEAPGEGWIVVGAYDNDGNFTEYSTDVVFDPLVSGESYTAIFLNTPTQGCTPGFWGGGSDGGQAGGQWLWDEIAVYNPNDPDWYGDGTNPFVWDREFGDFFTPSGVAEVDGLTMHELVNSGGGTLDQRKAARSLVAAYLNASWGMAYAYTTGELIDLWNDAVAGDITFLDLHTDLDAANNAMVDGVHNCPIDASLN